MISESLLYPFLRYHNAPKDDLQSATFLSQNPKLFELRTFQNEKYKIGQLKSKEDSKLNLSAKGRPWTLTMSSQYGGLSNDYASLVSENWNYPGAGTNYGANNAEGYQYIQATFDAPVHVSKFILSGPSKGAFRDQGWGFSYLTQLSIQYSVDDESPFTLIKNLAEITENDGPIEIDVSDLNIVGKRFRLTSVGYVATGSFIME